MIVSWGWGCSETGLQLIEGAQVVVEHTAVTQHQQCVIVVAQFVWASLPAD